MELTATYLISGIDMKSWFPRDEGAWASGCVVCLSASVVRVCFFEFRLVCLQYNFVHTSGLAMAHCELAIRRSRAWLSPSASPPMHTCCCHHV